MKRKLIYSFALVLALSGLQAQVGIGTENPRGGVDINSPTTNTWGLVLPTNDDAGNIVNPQGGNVAIGTIMYDSTLDCVRVYKSDGWSGCIGDGSGSSSSSANGKSVCPALTSGPINYGINTYLGGQTGLNWPTRDYMSLFIGGDGIMYTNANGSIMSTDSNYGWNKYQNDGNVVAPFYALEELYPSKKWKEFYNGFNVTTGDGPCVLALSTDGHLYYLKYGNSTTSKHSVLGGPNAMATATTMKSLANGAVESWEIFAYDDSGNIDTTVLWNSFHAMEADISSRAGVVVFLKSTTGKVYSYAAAAGTTTKSLNMRPNATTLLSSLQARPATWLNNMLTRNNTTWKSNTNDTPTFSSLYTPNESGIDYYFYSFLGENGKVYSMNNVGANYVITAPSDVKAFLSPMRIGRRMFFLCADGKVYVPNRPAPGATVGTFTDRSGTLTGQDVAYTGTVARLMANAGWNALTIIDADVNDNWGLFLASDGNVYSNDYNSVVASTSAPALVQMSNGTTPAKVPKFRRLPSNYGQDINETGGPSFAEDVNGKYWTRVANFLNGAAFLYDLEGITIGGNSQLTSRPGNAVDCFRIKPFPQ